MNLTVKCKNCNTINKTPNHHTDRIKYAMKYGDDFEVACSNCSEMSAHHVDDIVARSESLVQVVKRRLLFIGIVLGISIIVSLFLLDRPSFAAGVYALPIVSIIFFQWFETSSISEFNAHKLKGRNIKVSIRK